MFFRSIRVLKPHAFMVSVIFHPYVQCQELNKILLNPYLIYVI
jgi:hypothetical protein